MSKKNGCCPLWISLIKKHCNISKLLLQHMYNVNEIQCEQIFSKYNSDLNEFTVNTVNGIDLINEVSYTGTSALLISCFYGLSNAINILFNNNMNFTNTKDAFYIACIEGNIQNVKQLLQLISVDEILTSSGSTALIIACGLGYNNLVHFLLDNKADTTICTINGDTPLSISIDNGNIACVEILLKYIYSDPQALLKFQSNLWNFDNNTVNAYRKYSNQKRYPISITKQIEQRLFPEYFSEIPLPSNCSRGLLKIRMPQHLCQHRRYCLSSFHIDMSKASDVIKSSIGRLDEPPQRHYRNDFMIKITGQESYMYGRKHVIGYEAIRIAFHNQDDVEFRLVKIENCLDKIRKELDEFIDKLLCGYLRGFVTLTMTNLFKQFVGSNIGANTKQINDGHVVEKEKKMDILMQQNVISLYNLDSKYKLKIKGLTNVKLLPQFDAITMKSIYVMVELWIGDQIFDQSTMKTDNMIPNNNIKWCKWLYCNNYSFLYSQIPREAVLCFMIISDNDQCLAWCRVTLVDYKMMLRQGKYLLNMWEIPVPRKTRAKHELFKDRTFRYKGTVTDKKLKNIDTERQCQLAIEFDTFGFDVIAPKYLPDIEYKEDVLGIKLNAQQVNKLQKQKLDKLLYHTPLSKTIDMEAKTLIWQARDLLYSDPKSLSVFLKSVNWTKISHILEAHKYLALWCPPRNPQNALEYLSFKFGDTKVREKAVEWMDEMHNSELCNIMLPLVQCLKYELYHNSCLEIFLLNRAIESPNQIGHLFFWYLFEEFNSENLEYRERFGLLLEEYLSVSVEHSKQLFLQMAFVKRLQIISNKMKSSQCVNYDDEEYQKDDISMKRLFYNELNELNEEIVSRIQLPLNPRMYAKNVVVEKCEYKICKTENYLLLMLQNTDEYAHDIAIKFMFGSENNLKENMLIIQLFNILDRIWLNAQCDALLKPYSIWTMGNIGMIEIIQNSQTITDINAEFGGGFHERTIEKYLKKFNTYDQSLKKARDAFAKSCAAYCIGTMILGITDRNEDNCMVTQNGHCFHVNFEYILGNHKKIRFQRERAACFMNPQMKYAINGGKKAPLWNMFMNWCSELYNVIRLRSKSLFVILTLMISYGSPQLLNESDIQYVETMLHLQYDNKKAEKYVQKQIKVALKDKMKRYFDDYAFLMPHRHS
eukprot:549718_1